MFQSTPPHGGRRTGQRPAKGGHRGFNPRPHTGGDLNATGVELDGRRVSIHAPTRGATARRGRWRTRCRCFNPRPHTGGDVSKIQPCLSLSCFNPRPHTGGDLCRWLYTRNEQRFQSTPPHGGRRSAEVGGETVSSVSIHAPTRGATSCLLKLFRCLLCFNPRPHTGGDCS